MPMVEIDKDFIGSASKSLDRKFRVQKARILNDVKNMIRKQEEERSPPMEEEEEIEKNEHYPTNNGNRRMPEEQLVEKDDVLEEGDPLEAILAKLGAMEARLSSLEGGPEGEQFEQDLEDPASNIQNVGNGPVTANKSLDKKIQVAVTKALEGSSSETPGAPGKDSEGGDLEIFKNSQLFNKSWQEIEHIAKNKWTDIPAPSGTFGGQ